jgi:hypothetical protein
VAAFIIAWLAVQLAVPFIRKFEWPSLRYRLQSSFDWSPYSSPSLVYDVSLSMEAEDGSAEAIPDIGRYVAGLTSPDAITLRAPNYNVEWVQYRYARLMEFIARQRDDGRVYQVSIHWIKHYRPDLPDQWEFSTRGADQ